MLRDCLNLILCAWLLVLQPVQAAEFTARLSLLGNASKANQGDIGYENGSNNRLHADQETLRLMLDDYSVNTEWSIHVNTSRQYFKGFQPNPFHSSDLFRYDELAHDWVDEIDGRSTTLVGYEIDRLFYEYQLENLNLGLGRQPVDWGSGRFWQPMNVFGAFAPTALDTAYKPGIDIATFDWYPSPFFFSDWCFMHSGRMIRMNLVAAGQFTTVNNWESVPRWVCWPGK